MIVDTASGCPVIVGFASGDSVEGEAGTVLRVARARRSISPWRTVADQDPVDLREPEASGQGIH